MPIVKLQPSTGLDTFLLHFTGSDDLNFSTEDVLTIQPYSSTVIKRILLKFDITSIPVDATIVSAKIGLNLKTAAEATSINMEAHSITRSWTPSTATWNRYDGANNWSTAGGDFDVTVLDTVAVGNAVQLYEWDIPAATVQGWFTTNNGILFKGSNEDSGVSDKSFHSAESATANLRPYLEITYSVATSGYSFFM